MEESKGLEPLDVLPPTNFRNLFLVQPVTLLIMEEGKGLEPLNAVNVYEFSKLAPRPAGHLPNFFLSI